MSMDLLCRELASRNRWVWLLVLALWVPLLHADWEEGAAAFTAGDYQKAEASFETVVASRPNYAPGHFMLGLSLYHLDRNDAALSSLSRAVELDPTNVQYRLALTRAELDGERFDDAASNVLQVDIDRVRAELRSEYAQLLAEAVTRSSHAAEAVARLEAATALLPRDAGLWVALGEARSAAGNDVAAFEAFSKAAAIDGSGAIAGRKAARAAVRIANTLAEGSDRGLWYGWAAELADKAATTSGDAADALLAGEAYLGAGDAGRAREWLDRVLAREPDNALALYLLGRAEVALDQDEQALRHLTDALGRAGEQKLRRAIAYSIAQVEEKRRDFAAAQKTLLELGDGDGAAGLQRLAEVVGSHPGPEAASCLDRWVRLQGAKEDRRLQEGTPAWAAILAEESKLLATCGATLGLSASPG